MCIPLARFRLFLHGWVLACALALAPSAWAQTDQPIYVDALVNGWQNWSWATVNLANGSPVHSGTRSAIYSVDVDGVLILAIAHHSRRPGYWSGRVDSPEPDAR